MKSLAKYNFYKLRKICLYLILLGSLNCGTKLFNVDLVKMLGEFIRRNTGYNASNLINILIAISVIYLYFTEKNLFTPFLGDAVLPCSVINKEPPKDADFEKVIQTEPNKKIVYWASLKNKDNLMVWDAYGDYSNSGVVFSDDNGKAVLKLNKPSSYVLPSGNSLSKHIHYRVCPNNEDAEGMMSELKTIYL